MLNHTLLRPSCLAFITALILGNPSSPFVPSRQIFYLSTSCSPSAIASCLSILDSPCLQHFLFCDKHCVQHWINIDSPILTSHRNDGLLPDSHNRSYHTSVDSGCDLNPRTTSRIFHQRILPLALLLLMSSGPPLI